MFLYTINDKVAQDTGPVFEAKTTVWLLVIFAL